MFKTWIVAALAGSAALLVASWSLAAENPDASFVEKASTANMKEIQTSTVAQEKATDAGVKAFAKQMIQDHQQAGTELSDLATKKGVPATTAKDEKEVTSAVDKLNKTEAGAAFDKEYVAMMVKDHEKVVKLFEKEAKSGEDADFKALAEKLLPTLQGHLKMAQDLEATVKKEK